MSTRTASDGPRAHASDGPRPMYARAKKRETRLTWLKPLKLHRMMIMRRMVRTSLLCACLRIPYGSPIVRHEVGRRY
eukprot:6185798-Pleurochrysis_carterae.AAC.2